MLRTFVAPFGFHQRNGGRGHFEELASRLSERFEDAPDIVVDPIFSYGSIGSDGVARLADLDESRSAIVYLSNIVMHSSILILGNCDAPELQFPLQYDSIRTFLNAPFTCGFSVDRNKRLNSNFTDSTVVVSDLATFRNDGHIIPETKGMFRILDFISDVYFVNVLDFEQYFEHLLMYGDHPFFLTQETIADFSVIAKHYANDTLREYLNSSSYHFATLGDDHSDDEFAVSYGANVWRIDGNVAFMR